MADVDPTPLRAISTLAPARGPVSRRTALLLAFWSGAGAVLAGATASIANFLWPRRVEAFGGPVGVPASAIPAPGGPPYLSVEGRFLLVNLRPGEGGFSGTEASPGGLLALWWKCPHLGCTVPWRGDATHDKDVARRKGIFLCGCHGSTYTKAGVRIFGPAPRSMDTMRIEPGATGITVQTGDRTNGGPDNPLRAVPWPPPEPAGP